MTDPTPGRGVAEEEAGPSCERCGDPVEGSTDRRVVTWVEDGEARHSHFCGEECFGAREE